VDGNAPLEVRDEKRINKAQAQASGAQAKIRANAIPVL